MSENNKQIVLGLNINGTDEVKNAVSEVKKLGDALEKTGKQDVGVGNIKNFKQQIKEATQAAQALQQAGKENTEEFRKAVTTIAELRDQQDSLNKTVSAFNPDNKFASISKFASAGASAIGGMVGATELLGLSSATAEDAIKKMVAIQGIVGMIDSMADLNDFYKAFILKLGVGTAAKNADTVATGAQVVATNSATVATNGLGLAFKALGIGLIVGAIVLLVSNFEAIKNVVSRFLPGLKLMGDLFIKITQTVTDFVGVTSAAERGLDRLTSATNRNNQAIDNGIKLLEAKGGREAQIYQLSEKRINNELNLLRETLKVKGTLSAEDQKRFKELKLQQEIDKIEEKKRIDEVNKQAAEKRKAESDKIKEKQKADAARAKAEADKIKEKQKADLALIKQSTDAANKVVADANRTAREKELNELELKYKDEIALAKKYGKDTSVLTNAKGVEASAINNKYDSQDAINKANNVLSGAETGLVNAESNAINENDSPETATAKIEAITSAKLNAENAAFELKKLQLVGQKEQLALLEADHQQRITDINQENADVRKEIADKETEYRKSQLNEVGATLDAAASMFSENTVAYKGLAIAGATMNAYKGITEVLASQSVLKEPYGSIAKGISAAAIGANAFKQVKAISSVQIKGKSGGGGGAPSFSAPIINSTILQKNNSGSSDIVDAVSKQNKEPVKAYIVQKDLTSNQAKEDFYNQQSSL
jgi:hypothetical protein